MHTRLLISRSHTPPSRPFFFHSLFRARVRACVHTYINTCMHAYIQKIHTYLRVEVKRGAKRALFEFGFDSRQLRCYVDRLCGSHAHTHTQTRTHARTHTRTHAPAHTHARADTHTHTHTHTHVPSSAHEKMLVRACINGCCGYLKVSQGVQGISRYLKVFKVFKVSQGISRHLKASLDNMQCEQQKKQSCGNKHQYEKKNLLKQACIVWMLWLWVAADIYEKKKKQKKTC